MNSNYGKNFDFDLGFGSSRPKSLNDQKNSNNSSYSSYSSSSYSSAQPKPAWQPNKPSWTHQPAPSQAARPGLSSGSTSMVGDIFGKSWSSGSSAAGIGTVDKNPNLFGDLVGSALGQGKNTNVPLKNSTPVSSSTPFSVGGMANSLPKTDPNPVKSGGNWGSSRNFTGNVNANNNRTPNLGDAPIKNIGGGGGSVGGGMSSKDPFGSLVDFRSKPSSNLNSTNKSNKVNTGDDVSGIFQNVPQPQPQSIPSTNTFQSNSYPAKPDKFSNLNMDDLVKPSTQNPTQSAGSDPLDMFFPSNTTNLAGGATTNGSGGQQRASEIDDWGIESEFGGDGGGPTTELDGLPPPPASVNASAAKNKGMDNYKQGQYADAIKWLSWAVILLEKAGDNATIVEVLSSRASCYKEVGEYKKAVADCTKVLEQDDANVSVLVQRALLYESMEKYRLGAEDLRTVLKIDPTNRIARSTIHRLTKLAD
ncbi:N-terminal acetyltransferase A, auxiliary subunit [Parasponia andersonii]|uniref:N-terminal acetyltransferase A, auxiliary subunit n=1 Tax=Parasponia andersonii TaxID=3476 RepID=A0A2P5CLN2_PARAD|nr:N-terminal acetyltransferase A, auxiliary subunit [Parasponia andersonii]